MILKHGKRYGKRRQAHSILLAAGLAVLGSGGLLANGLPVNGTILGIFSNPVLQGNIANSPSLGQLQFYDNSSTATVSINNSTNPAVGGTPLQQTTGSSLVWGSAADGGSGTFSILNFFGGQVPADVNQPFQLGTITFFNGTSDLTSLIFGATLSFYDNVVSPETFLGSDQVIITTTSNITLDASGDADYLNICGNSSNICSSSIKAVESTQGGSGYTANLFGAIVGDPVLYLNAVTSAPGQSTTTNGSIGVDPALGTVPEPGTLLLVPGSLAALAWLRRRRAAGA